MKRNPSQWKGNDEMNAKIRKEQARQFCESIPEGRLVEHRKPPMGKEEGGYATIEEIRRGLFRFMPAITRHMHSPGSEVDDRKRQSSEE